MDLFLLFQFLFSLCHLFHIFLFFLLLFFCWRLDWNHLKADNPLLDLDSGQGFESLKRIILRNCVNAFQKRQNIPNLYFSISLSCHQIFQTINFCSLHSFDPSFMSLEMDTMIIVAMLPYFNFSFFSYIISEITCNK